MDNTDQILLLRPRKTREFITYRGYTIVLLIAVILGLEIWRLRQSLLAAEFLNEWSFGKVRSDDARGARDRLQSYLGRYWGDIMHYRLNPPGSILLTRPDSQLVGKLAQLSALKSLQISGDDINVDGHSWSVNQLRSLQTLERFSVDRTADANELIEALSMLPRMTSISFHSLQRERVSLGPLLRLKSLNRLELGEYDLVEEELAELCRQVPLESMKLFRCRIVNQSVGNQEYRNRLHLNSIDLQFMAPSSDWLVRLVSKCRMKRFATVECGGLFQEALESTGCKSLEECVIVENDSGNVIDVNRWTCSNLRALKLVFSELPDSQLKGLMRFSELTDLNLKCQTLNDEQFRLPLSIRNLALPQSQSFSPEIWRVLQSLPQLNILDIVGTAVDDSDIVNISQLRFIKEIDVRHTALTEQGVGALQALMPGVNIRHSWTEEDKLLLEFLDLELSDKSVEQ